jgi:hypothetical protein
LIRNFVKIARPIRCGSQKTKKTTVKIIAHWADMPPGKRMQLQDQVMKRALELWHKKGRGHRDALAAWLQAEREVLAQNGMNWAHSQW